MGPRADLLDILGSSEAFDVNPLRLYAWTLSRADMPLPASLRRWALFIVLLATLAALGWGIRFWMKRPPFVEVATVTEGKVERVLALTGRVRAQQRYQLTPLVSGRLEELRRAEGERTQKDEVLARIDDRTARATLAGAEADRLKAAEEVEQARRDLARVLKLQEDGLVAAADAEARQLILAQREQGLASLARRRDELASRLRDYLLRSPIDGRVLERPVDPGQTVDPQDVIYVLATEEQPEIEAEVDERYLAELSLGMPAQGAAIGGDKVWPLEVNYLGYSIDRLSGAAILRLHFLDQGVELPIGLTLDVNLVVERRDKALTVPRAAIAGLGGDTWTLEVVGGRTIRRDLKVIDWPAERLIVLEGLRAGAQVVLEPAKASADIDVRTRPAKAGK